MSRPEQTSRPEQAQRSSGMNRRLDDSRDGGGKRSDMILEIPTVPQLSLDRFKTFRRGFQLLQATK